MTPGLWAPVKPMSCWHARTCSAKSRPSAAYAGADATSVARAAPITAKQARRLVWVTGTPPLPRSPGAASRPTYPRGGNLRIGIGPTRPYRTDHKDPHAPPRSDRVPPGASDHPPVLASDSRGVRPGRYARRDPRRPAHRGHRLARFRACVPAGSGGRSGGDEGGDVVGDGVHDPAPPGDLAVGEGQMLIWSHLYGAEASTTAERDEFRRQHWLITHAPTPH